MSSEDSKPGVGVYVGAGVGACIAVIGSVAIFVCCYMKSRKKKAHTNMTKCNAVFSTAASSTKYDHAASRSRVNRNPDPERERRIRQWEEAHDNLAFTRHHRPVTAVVAMSTKHILASPASNGRGGHVNEAYSSESSFVDSSFEDVTLGNETGGYSDRYRSSFKASKRIDLLDTEFAKVLNRSSSNDPNYRKTDDTTRERQSYVTNVGDTRSNSPLTVASLARHESLESEKNSQLSRKGSQRRESFGSVEGSVFGTVVSSDRRYVKNKRVHNSPIAEKRYRDTSHDNKGHKRPHRTLSADGKSHTDRRSHRAHERSKSPGGGSHSSTGSWQTKSSVISMNRQQAMLPIVMDVRNKRR